jgi:hypothetical protein
MGKKDLCPEDCLKRVEEAIAKELAKKKSKA